MYVHLSRVHMPRRISVEPALPGRVLFLCFCFFVEKPRLANFTVFKSFISEIFIHTNNFARSSSSPPGLRRLPSWVVLDEGSHVWQASGGVAATAQKPLKVQNSLQSTLPIFSYCEMSLEALKLARREESSAVHFISQICSSENVSRDKSPQEISPLWCHKGGFHSLLTV